jgi:DNA-binding beta-propeller fold protein YncE
MKTKIAIGLLAVAATLCAALMTLMPLPGSLGHAAAATYQRVDNWAQLPQGMTRWSEATGVAIDAHGTIYVHHRHYAMPIMAFDGNGRFLRSWGQGMFTSAHVVRTDPSGNIWVTDLGAHQVFKLSAEGQVLMTLGKKGVAGDNESQDAFNRPADVVIATDGSIFIADGERGGNTRVVQYSQEGKFVKYWGGKGTDPGKFDLPHSIAMDSRGRIYVADRGNNRIQLFDQDGTYRDQWTNVGTPWGLFITSDDMLYVVDGVNCLRIASTRDGSIVDRIEGLFNPHAVAVDNKGAIYIAEWDGMNVKKFVKR